MNDPSLLKIGPLGYIANNEITWDEKGMDQLVQIFISYGEGYIYSLQFHYYAENGTPVLSGIHGSSSRAGCNFVAVKLNYPAEYITWVKGRHGAGTCYGPYGLLNSITFGTNQGVYGPFGEIKSNQKEFNIQLGESRQFAGFHGTSYGGGISSIGVYLRPNNIVTNLAGDPLDKKRTTEAKKDDTGGNLGQTHNKRARTTKPKKEEDWE